MAEKALTLLSQVLERLRSCEAAIELLGKYDTNISGTTTWMDELDNKLKNYEALEAARAKEAWEKHVVSGQQLGLFILLHLIPDLGTLHCETFSAVSACFVLYCSTSIIFFLRKGPTKSFSFIKYCGIFYT